MGRWEGFQAKRAPRRALRFATLLVAIAVGGVPRAAHATPQEVLGYGARASALAATGAAWGEGYEAVHANPALLSLSRDTKLSLGLVGAVFDLEAGGPVATDGLSAGVLGATLPVPVGGWLDDRLTLGLGFQTPFDVVVRSRILRNEAPQHLLPDRVQCVAVQAGAGLDVGHGLRLGVGFAALAALTGTVLVSVDGTGRIGAVVEDTLVASYAPTFGASYDVGPDYRVGFVARGPLEARFDVRIDVRDLGTIVVPPLFVSGTAQYDPMTFGLEFARVSGPLRGAVGVSWERWSAYPGTSAPTVRCPLDPSTGGPLSCAALGAVDPDFSDTVVPRAALEWTLAPARGTAIDLRLGYAFEPGPAPEQRGLTNLFDEARSQLTTGVGAAFEGGPLGGVTLDVFGQLHVLHGRVHEKGAGVPADHPGAPSIETGGTAIAGGTVLGVAL